MAKAITHNRAGRITSRLLGNGLTQSFAYYGWAEKATVDGAQTGQGGRLKNLMVGSLQNLTYKYDEAGNVKEIANSVAPETQGYTYDALNRLSSWTLDGVQKTYSYNTAGNLGTKEGVTLTYGDSSHPHAATAAGDNSYSYDANGSMTLRGPTGQEYTLAYDAEGRLVTVSGPSGFSAAFTYDGDGKRVKSTINSVSTIFVGNYYEKTGSTITEYYYAPPPPLRGTSPKCDNETSPELSALLIVAFGGGRVGVAEHGGGILPGRSSRLDLHYH